MKKNLLKDILVFVVITVAASLSLAMVNSITKDPIARQNEKIIQDSYRSVFKEGQNFDNNKQINHLKEDSTIYIRVEDRNLCIQPIGKQSWKKENFLCWYTRTVGIWQQVWIEEVGEIYLTDIKMTPQIDNASIDCAIFF